VATRILVTGGTGTLGREVVRQAAGGDRVVRVLSRRPRPDHAQPGATEWAVGDIGAGQGIEAAVAEVDTIIHCASDFRRAKRDLPGVRRFLDAARRAGVAHLVPPGPSCAAPSSTTWSGSSWRHCRGRR
jgi:nucleoside-diphosphate-sugar epimerase